MRTFFANFHGVLLLAYVVTFFYVWRKSGKQTMPTPMNTLSNAEMWAKSCLLIGTLIKICEDAFVPYVQGLGRPLSQDEWWWRTSAALVLMAGLPALAILIRTVKQQTAQSEI